MTNEIGNYRTNISITIRVSLLAEADKKAEEEDISRSALFELAMKDYLNDRKYYCENHNDFVSIRHNQNDIVCNEDNCHWIVATYKEEDE